MTRGPDIVAWRPTVAGIVEVFHAHFTEYAYPLHVHDAWTLLIIDAGAVYYSLDHREHVAHGSVVTLLPPHIPHDGHPIRPEGFRKRVLYLERGLFPDELIHAAADDPELQDPLLRQRLHQFHQVLAQPADDLEAQSRFALIRERLLRHLRSQEAAEPQAPRAPRVARQFRELLDAHTEQGLSLDAAAGLLSVHPAHLVRVFSREYGIPPHRYLITRRVDLARRLLLGGHQPADVARMAGFYDQSHLNRYFKRLVGTSPASYVRAAAGAASAPANWTGAPLADCTSQEPATASAFRSRPR